MVPNRLLDIERECWATYANGTLTVETPLREGESPQEIADYLTQNGINVNVEVYPLNPENSAGAIVNPMPASTLMIEGFKASSLDELIALASTAIARVDAARLAQIDGKTTLRTRRIQYDQTSKLDESLLEQTRPPNLKKRN